MRISTGSLAVSLLFCSAVSAADIQGVLTDWNCTEKMVRNGREKTLEQDKNCSLVPKSDRAAYGLITSEKKFYRFDDSGNRRAKELLNNSHDKNNLRVIATGELEGNLIKVKTMSIL